MGASVSFSTTLSVSVCSGGRTTATWNCDDVPSCAVSTSLGANRTDQAAIPSAGGATSSTSVQYKALVPAHGATPSEPRAATAPLRSQISMRSPSSPQAPDDFAPTLMVKGSPVTTDEGMAQTARLVVCGLVLTLTEVALSSWRMPSISCDGNATRQACWPTSRGALNATAPIASPAASRPASAPVAMTPSVAVTWI